MGLGVLYSYPPYLYSTLSVRYLRLAAQFLQYRLQSTSEINHNPIIPINGIIIFFDKVSIARHGDLALQIGLIWYIKYLV